jgi:NAD-dependent deacetylase
MARSIDLPLVALTGAGISAESGVPTFRGAGGFWREHRPEDLATPEAFCSDPGLVWDWYAWRRELIAACRPNDAHRTLADIENDIDDFVVVTQNVDGLHQAAGSQRVLELHGSIWRLRCTHCDYTREDRRVPLPDLPPHCPECSSLLRPDVVWFGESLPMDAVQGAWSAAAQCGTMLVIGTSAVVEPAASLPRVAHRHDSRLIEFNPERTPASQYADEVFREPAGEALPRWWQGARAHEPH